MLYTIYVVKTATDLKPFFNSPEMIDYEFQPQLQHAYRPIVNNAIFLLSCIRKQIFITF